MVATENKLASMDRVSRSASSNLAGMAATSPLHSDGSLAYRPSAAGAEAKTRLGFEFAKSSDTIVSWSNNTEAPVKVRRAASQGVEVFEALVTAGLSTAYGLNMINMVIQKQEAMASKVATTAT
jgi:hypothetical protein